MEERAPLMFVVLGVLMLVVAAAAGLSPPVAITFAVLGAALVALGGLLRLLEGDIKLGPSGLEVQLRLHRPSDHRGVEIPVLQRVVREVA